LKTGTGTLAAEDFVGIVSARREPVPVLKSPQILTDQSGLLDQHRSHREFRKMVIAALGNFCPAVIVRVQVPGDTYHRKQEWKLEIRLS
jgi:hypothetical protein